MSAEQIKIRPARPEDAGEIAQVHILTWQTSYAGLFPEEKLEELAQEYDVRTERWYANITNPDQLPALFVAETENSKIVGFAGGGKQNNPDYPYDSEIYMIYILPEFQRRGLGQALMSATAGKLQELGFRSLMLWVLQENEASRQFYEKLGGKQAGRDEYLRWDESHALAAYAWDSLDALIISSK
jgi:ribosomal protein S18 acetylase RimI-like enzyme